MNQLRATKAALLAALLCAAGASGQQRNTRVELGTVSAAGGKVTFSINSLGGTKQAAIFVTDRNVISTNFLMMSPGQLKQMRGLIDEALDEVEPGWNQGQAAGMEIARVVSEAGRACRVADTVDLNCASAVSACGRSSVDKASAEACVSAVPKPPQK